MSDWAIVAVDDGRWREAIVAALEVAGIEALETPNDPCEILALLGDEIELPPLLVWHAADPSVDDLQRLVDLRRDGVGVVVVADQPSARVLRRVDRAGLLSRAWRYGSAAVISYGDHDGLVRVAREQLRTSELRGPAASWRVSRLCLPAA